jgi:hypothetical protein
MASPHDRNRGDDTMPQYMLLMYHPAGEYTPDPDTMAAQRERWTTFHKSLTDAGVLVSNTGLQGVEAATTVRVRDGETQITDGPFAETKEVLAGYFLIEVPDLDTALKYAADVPSAGYGSVEVRPSWGA